MTKLSRELAKRCDNKCELCTSDEGVQSMPVAPKDGNDLSEIIAVCSKCYGHIQGTAEQGENHWRCLNDCMWSEVPAVQVVSYRLLQELTESTDWAGDLVDMMYLEDDVLAWAKKGLVDKDDRVVHKDCNGAILSAGDSVVLIQDLNVKGSSLTAKRGVAVRRIRLDPDNAEYIEGKVDGQHIVILTKYVKKMS